MDPLPSAQQWERDGIWKGPSEEYQLLLVKKRALGDLLLSYLSFFLLLILLKKQQKEHLPTCWLSSLACQ